MPSLRQTTLCEAGRQGSYSSASPRTTPGHHVASARPIARKDNHPAFRPRRHQAHPLSQGKPMTLRAVQMNGSPLESSKPAHPLLSHLPLVDPQATFLSSSEASVSGTSIAVGPHKPMQSASSAVTGSPVRMVLWVEWRSRQSTLTWIHDEYAPGGWRPLWNCHGQVQRR